MKDWTGNNRTLGATLGASYLASGERPREDYYATHPDMVRDLLNAGGASPETCMGTGLRCGAYRQCPAGAGT